MAATIDFADILVNIRSYNQVLSIITPNKLYTGLEYVHLTIFSVELAIELQYNLDLSLTCYIARQNQTDYAPPLPHATFSILQKNQDDA